MPSDQPEQPGEPMPGEAGDPGDPGPSEEVAGHHDAGLDLARDVGKATAAGSLPPTRRRRRSTGSGADQRVPRGRVSGARPDERDPQLLEITMDRLVADHGWELDLKVHAVFGRWAELVGDQVGDHSRPESFADGRLVVRTDSTAWATQLRLLAPSVVRRLNEELGHGTVTFLEVLGPHAPSWRKGRWSVRDGRGPRDTYG